MIPNKTIRIEIPVTPIFVEDKNNKTFTAYFKEFPEVITEGKTMEKALRNLKMAIFDVFKYKNTLPS
jgi:predicted RNase H-like HicB family nuclease